MSILEVERVDEPESDDNVVTPIDLYFQHQHTLTAVELFSERHDACALPSEARHYRDLIPLEHPKAGQQYAFEVDLDSCSGCKACVTACHSLNGLDEGESWRSVGTLVEGNFDESVVDLIGGDGRRQTVTTACHHCIDPACLNGCPVDAYEKDPFTGIVKHLDDQCIGCGYCTMMCPYEIPQMNERLGIVRKCDMCADRLADGEAPACVQACPTSAISVTIVEVAEAIVEAAARSSALMPSAPASHITVPTTRFRSSRPLDDSLISVDQFSLKRAHAHRALVAMLVMTQMSVGAFVADLVLRLLLGEDLLNDRGLGHVVRTTNVTVALSAVVVGIAASVAHLGRPRYAFRAVIGLRHSWLSREIVAFAIFAALAGTYTTVAWIAADSSFLGPLGLVVACMGMVAIGCSAMIYVVTRRAWWCSGETALKFFSTALVTGSAAVLAIATVIAANQQSDGSRFLADSRPLAGLLGAAALIKLIREAAIFRHLRDDTFTERRRTALLMVGELRAFTNTRFACGVIGGVFMPICLALIWSLPHPPTMTSAILGLVMLALVVVGELCERLQFFAAAAPLRMPGEL